MKFSEVVIQAAALIRERQRMTYRALKLEFELADDAFEALKEELLFAHPEIADTDGRGFIWRSVDSMTTEAAVPPTQHEVGPPPIANPETRGANGEYRQLSVMFCDLVGSTALATELEPEALHGIMQTYHATCATVVARYDGHIAQYLGDGVLVYFGYPSAHEDDAARAVHAGLEILQAMHGRHGHGTAVEVRIGIHTGPVMVTDVGSGAHQETLALGETPNLASRIQHRAAPSTLVIGATTARLIRGLFELERLGPQALAGVAAPHELFRVLTATAQRSAFEAAVLRGLTPVVGREHETGLILERMARVTEGYGQVVLISGEPGIGKSRLVQAAKAHGDALHAEYRCSAHFQHTALYPVIAFLERALQFERGESSAAKIEKLADLITEFQLPLADALPLLAALLSLPSPAGHPAMMLSPAQQRQRTLSVLLDSILNAAARRPVCLVWEDLHWADATTLEFMSMVIEQAATAQVMVLATYRPEFRAPWSGRAHISALTLSRLSPSQIAAMVATIANHKPLPAEVIQQILLKTDGVPLFVEELTKMILESDLLRETPDRYDLAGPLPPLAIPDTLQDSLQARLDRHPEAREVAQLGAVIGREFSAELIRAVSTQADAALDAGLRQLVDAELIFQRGRGFAASYLFKHALVQDTAYQSLLKRRRQQLHRQVAAVLQARFAETLAAQPELIAHHLTEAGQIETAIPYWQRAGQRALERSANVEAVAHLNKGVVLNRTLPGDPTNFQREISLLVGLAPALMATGGYASWTYSEYGKQKV
ncbi:MAG: AAA family ATPase [Gammaproteobacteria bacterium]|nr:AAA family ATPase [Gammaproteobacteria bacterium]